MSAFLPTMKAAGLDVNWLTLLVGMDGPGKHPPLLSLDDIAAYATEEIERSADSAAAAGVLASLDSGADEVRATMRRFAETQHANAEREVRKWTVILLKHAIRHLPSDPIYGLLALTEFWEQFDYPADSPHFVQGRGDSTLPGDYFTDENFRSVVQRHREWIASEVAALRLGSG